MSKGSTISVLLIEDNADHAELTRIAFEREGIESDFVHLTDGEQAVSYLTGVPPFGDEKRPDLVMLDLKMPKRSGFEVLDFIRSQESLRDLLVVIMTSSTDIDDLARADAHRPDAFLVKPVGPEALSTLLQELGLRSRPS